MINFTKPQNLNGSELRAELRQAGVIIADDIDSVTLSNDELGLKIAATDKDKAAAVVAAHNGTTIAPDTSADKAALLSKLGITEDEARLLLS
jgi:hypothetical protein